MQAHGFRVSFTPLLEVLFTFPSRYWFTIGLSVVFSLAGWSPLIPAEFLVFRGTQVPAGTHIRISGTGLSPAAATLSCVFPYPTTRALAPVLQPRARPQGPPRFGLLRVRSPLLAQSLLFSFPAGTEMFQFPAFAPRGFPRGAGIAPGGFPHSDIRGSQGICPSPRLFAACHVLRRLREPQASPMRPSLLSLFLSLARPAFSCSLESRFFIASSCYSLSQFFKCSTCSQHVNEPISSVVPGRLELPTSTLSV